MSDVERRPTVVIGSGLGGLCCAAFLARDGVPVTVVEQYIEPGGYTTSFERDDGRFDFEVPLHGTSIDDNGVARILDELDVLAGAWGTPVVGSVGRSAVARRRSGH